MSAWMVGIDTGGTFTDLIAVERDSGELRLAKIASVPADPASAVLTALGKLFAGGVKPAEVTLLVHGTTVATNALIEGAGVRAGLLITRGFRAVYVARGWSQPLGTDLLEVGYYLRQGVDLAHHEALWDIMSRNALFLTGNGTNDDHFGKNWLAHSNNWFSSVWAKNTGHMPTSCISVISPLLNIFTLLSPLLSLGLR